MPNWSKRTTAGFKSGTRLTKTINSSGKTRSTLSRTLSDTPNKKGQGSIRITNTIDSSGNQRSYQTTTSPLGFRTTETLYKSPKTTVKTVKPKKIRMSSGRRKSSKTQPNYSTQDNSDGITLFLVFFIGAIIFVSLLL